MEKIKLSQIKPNPANPRVIKDDKFKKLVKSISDFPTMMELRPIIVDENMVTLGGNMRLRALKELAYKEIPSNWVKQASELSEEQKKQFIIKDNVGFGEWDWDILANEWDESELIDWGLDIPDFSNEDPLDEAEEDGYGMSDEIPTDIILGDLFEIGDHRLLCGDSTDSDQVAKLLGAYLPVLMVTDPPYGVSYDPSWREKVDLGIGKRSKGLVKNDDKIDWTQAYALFTGDVAYVWHAGKYTDIVLANLKDCGFEPISQIIWAKQHFALSRGDYHWQHEPCWYVVKNGKKHNWQGDRTQSTLWEINNNNSFGNSNKEETFGHGTQKPMECMARPIKNNSRENDVIYDPFLGSGTTMAAAHQLKRKCCGMELDPKYCQAIINRMLKLDPTLTIKKNGEKYVPLSQDK